MIRIQILIQIQIKIPHAKIWDDTNTNQGHLGLNSKASHARKSVQIPMKTTNSTNSTQVGPT